MVRRRKLRNGGGAPCGVGRLLSAAAGLSLLGHAAAAAPTEDPWQLYMNSAAQAVKRGDIETAAVMLHAARKAASDENGDTPRYKIANLELVIVYYILKMPEKAKSLTTPGSFKFDVAEFDERFIEEADALRKFAEEYFDKSRETGSAGNMDEKERSQRRRLFLEAASRSAQMEAAIYRQAIRLKEGRHLDVARDRMKLAEALAWNGLYYKNLAQFDEAEKSFVEAERLWLNDIERLRRVSSLDRQFPSLQNIQNFTSAGAKLDLMLNAKMIRAQNLCLRASAALNVDPVDHQKAISDIDRSLAVAREVIDTAKAFEGGEARVAAAALSQAFCSEARYDIIRNRNPDAAEAVAASSEARQVYRTVLDKMTRWFGEKDVRTQNFATRYLALLRKLGANDEADALAKRFDAR